MIMHDAQLMMHGAMSTFDMTCRMYDECRMSYMYVVSMIDVNDEHAACQCTNVNVIRRHSSYYIL